MPSRKIRFLKTLGSLLMVSIVLGIFAFTPRSYTVPDPSTVSGGDIRVMTYNLRYSSSDYEAWETRKHAIVELIEDYGPDLIGFQEADTGWMTYLPETLEDYRHYGVGRDDGVNQGEYSPIFFLKDQFIVLGNGTFWLSETPETPSTGWDANNRRICSYIILENIGTGEVFAHFNTHLDHIGEDARRNGAELILSRIEDMEYPVFLTGDMNFLEGTGVYRIITQTLGDSKHLAEDSMSWGTMNYFTNLHMRFVPPIDFVFVDPRIKVSRYEVLYQHKVNGKPLSDHFPVLVDFQLD